MGPRRSLLSLAALRVATVVVTAPEVQAQSDCSLDGTTLTVTAMGTGETEISRTPGGQITVDGVPCQGATVTNVDTIVALDESSDGGTNVYVDLANGPLAPGATAEPTGTSEIEIELSLGGEHDDYDAIYIRGSEGPDSFAAGQDGIALNDDDDADLTSPNHLNADLRVRFEGRGDDDVITGQGGFGTGEPATGGIDLFGDDGDDTLTGGIAGDRFAGGAGADTIDGGGVDFFPEGVDNCGIPCDVMGFEDSPSGVIVDLAAGTATGGSADGDTFTRIDSVFGSSHDDVIFGDDTRNALLDGEGDDELHGRGGNDDLLGGIGADVIDGGEGDSDAAQYYDSPAAVRIDLSVPSAAGGYATGDTLSGIEELAGSNFDDTLTGSDASEEFEGYDGDDTIRAGGGNDYIEGSRGDDKMYGEGGNDVLGADAGRDGQDLFDGGPGTDEAAYYGRNAPISMSADGKANDGEPGEHDNLVNIENLGASEYGDILKGNNQKNVFKGKGGDDRIDGLGKADKLVGGSGDDFLQGGPGADVLKGGPGTDTCVLDSPRDKAVGCEKLRRHF